MSVMTRAVAIKLLLSEELASTISELKSVKESMEDMTDKETWGGDSWSEEFYTEVEQDIEYLDGVISKLKKMRRSY